MKRKIYKLSILVLVLVHTACVNFKDDPPHRISSGSDNAISVSVSCTMKDMVTKSRVNEVLVEDINLYVVNEAGDLVVHSYYETPAEITADVYKDMEYTLYVIANAGKSIEAKDVIGIENIVCTIASIEDMVSEAGGILMAGKSLPQMLVHGQNIEIGLTRCISKVVLSCNFDELDEDVKIDVKKVSLKNVPNLIFPFKENRITDESSSIDGAVAESPTVQMLQDGIVFYQYENLQGTLQPGNLDQKLKVWPDGDIHRDICSYIEIEALYCSSEKRGDIVYRFYLGKDMTSNYDVIRNTQHSLFVSFAGRGSVDETTWRVDNSYIEDLVTDISIVPQEYVFDKWGESVSFYATVLPVTANERRVIWESSNESVAVVDANGMVTSVGDGTCTIRAKSCDGTDIVAAATVVVDAKIHVTSVELSDVELEMYEGMEHSFVATVYPSNATNKDIIWKSSNEKMVTVDANGKAKGQEELGCCYIYAISADDNTKVAQCKVTLRERDIVIVDSHDEIYIKVGEKYQLKWYTFPSDAKVSFHSNNSPCVTVDEYGVITGIKPTSAIIDIFAFGSRDFFCVTVLE